MDDPILQILQKYILTSSELPYGRLPTIQECLFAIEYPDKAEAWVKNYLSKRPEFEKFLRFCLNPLEDLPESEQED